MTGRSYIAGLVVPDLVHPFFGQVAKGLSSGLRKKGYSLVLSSSEDDPELERQEIEQLLARRVDVLIVASAQSTVGDLPSPGRAEDSVCPDRSQLRRTGGELRRRGRCGGGRTRDRAPDRGRMPAHRAYRRAEGEYGARARDGFRLALRANRTACRRRPNLSRCASTATMPATPAATSAMKRLLATEAAAGRRLLLQRSDRDGRDEGRAGSRPAVPEDVAIAGCGNVAYADFLRVPLTSVDQQSDAIGERTARIGAGAAGRRSRRLAPRRYCWSPSW